MKLVLNRQFGRFALSDAARSLVSDLEPARNDPQLVRVVEFLGDAASGEGAKLEAFEIPDDAKWEVLDFDGMEFVTYALEERGT